MRIIQFMPVPLGLAVLSLVTHTPAKAQIPTQSPVHSTRAIHADAWVDELGSFNIGARIGSARWYVLLHGGVLPRGDTTRWIMGAGLGHQVAIARDGYLSFDITNRILLPDYRRPRYSNITSLRATAGTWLGGIAVFGGPTLNLHLTDAAEDVGLPPYTIGDARYDHLSVTTWVGIVAGMRF